MNIAIQNVVREIDFRSSLAADSDTAAKYFEDADAALRSLGPPSSRSGDAKRDAQDIKVRSRLIKEQFLRQHVGAIYDTVTDKRTRTLRVCDLLYTVADRFPGLVPTRQRIQSERALQLQSAKEGFEIDQGLFVAHILADPERGLHLVHAMLRPKREALEKFAEFQKNGVVELGEARVERRGNAGHVTSATRPSLMPKVTARQRISKPRSTSRCSTIESKLASCAEAASIIRNITAAVFSIPASTSRISITGRLLLPTSSSSANLACSTRSTAATGVPTPTANSSRITSKNLGWRRSSCTLSAAAVSSCA